MELREDENRKVGRIWVQISGERFLSPEIPFFQFLYVRCVFDFLSLESSLFPFWVNNSLIEIIWYIYTFNIHNKCLQMSRELFVWDIPADSMLGTASLSFSQGYWPMLISQACLGYRIMTLPWHVMGFSPPYCCSVVLIGSSNIVSAEWGSERKFRGSNGFSLWNSDPFEEFPELLILIHVFLGCFPGICRGKGHYRSISWYLRSIMRLINFLTRFITLGITNDPFTPLTLPLNGRISLLLILNEWKSECISVNLLCHMICFKMKFRNKFIIDIGKQKLHMIETRVA